MNKVSILERDWTPVESHRTGDHRQCGGSCLLYGTDQRKAPIWSQMLAEKQQRQTLELRIRSLKEDIALWRIEELRTYCRNHGIRGFSRANRETLEQNVLDSCLKHLSGKTSCGEHCIQRALD